MLRLALLLTLLPALALADVTGPARVIDGDTIEVAGERIRLHGIDAPEGRQACERRGVTWLCGAEASRALRGLADFSRGDETALEGCATAANGSPVSVDGRIREFSF